MTEHLTELHRLCNDNQSAVDLIGQAWSACETWDDLIDRDKPVSEEDINKLVTWALFDVQQNQVYQDNPSLAFILRVTVSNWLASNKLEKSNDREQRITAYTLRCCPYDFFVAVVLCVSGPQMADEAAYFFRSSETPDTLENFLSERVED